METALPPSLLPSNVGRTDKRRVSGRASLDMVQSRIPVFLFVVVATSTCLMASSVRHVRTGHQLQATMNAGGISQCSGELKATRDHKPSPSQVEAFSKLGMYTVMAACVYEVSGWR